MPGSDAGSRHAKQRRVDQEANRYAVEERLLDGRPVLLRSIRPDDKAALQEAMGRLGPESAYWRFLQAKRRLTDEELAAYTEVDFRSHVALVAVVREEGREQLVATSRYLLDPGAAVPTAEVAFTVDDAHQGLGLGTLLLKHLSLLARRAGVRRFRASVLAGNRRMLEVFAHSGLPLETEQFGETVECRMELGDGEIRILREWT
jgi:GNAT superfamily N-acetyltransferase